MGSLSPELSLLEKTNNKPSFVPNSINDFLSEVALIGSLSERLSRVDDFLIKLYEEKSKIDMFKRELPLTSILLDEAIETVRNELFKYKKKNSEEEKMKWMSSFQLWSNDDSKKTECESNLNEKPPLQNLQGVMEERTPVANDPFSSGKNIARRGAFLPFQGLGSFSTTAKGKENKVSSISLPEISFRTPESVTPKAEVGFREFPAVALSPPPQQHSASRKQRRCWSPELHKLFVHCLEQLGGSQVATPKQIRELMKVDGLTNDEVKSHLQKYRIHTRKVSNERTNSDNGSSMEYSDFQVGESSNSSSPVGAPLSNNTNVVVNSLNGDEEGEEKSENGYLHRKFCT